jgi:Domain of Unknown Function with PDB structure (DUF3857)
LERRGIKVFGRAAVLLFTATILASCSGLSFLDIASIRDSAGLERLPKSNDYPGADAVIILDRTDVRLEADRYLNYRTIREIRYVKEVFGDYENEARVEIPLPPGRSLLGIKAWTIQPDGKIEEVGPSDFYVVSGEWGRGSVFYADRQKVQFMFPDVRHGSVLEYVCEEEDDLPFPSVVWHFQDSVPVIKSIFTLSVPGWYFDSLPDSTHRSRWNYKTYNYRHIGSPTFDRHFSKTGLALTFEETSEWMLDSIPPFEAEAGMPPANLFRGYAAFAPVDWRNWDDASSWYYYGIFNPSLVITDNLRKVSEALTRKDSTDIKKIDSIVRFIEGIQYGPDSTGIGNLVTEYPQAVLEDGYGNESDLSILMIALLKSAGITAEPAFLITNSEGQVDTAFASWNFDHEIVKAETSDSTVFWLDPAVVHCRLGTVPSDDEGETALVINDDGTGALEKIPRSPAWSNGIFMDISEQARPDTLSDVTVVMRFEGQDELAMRNAFAGATPEEVREYCRRLVANNFNSFTLGDCSTSPVDSLGSYFTVSFGFRVPGLLHEKGGEYLLYADPLPATEDLSWLNGSLRKYPVRLDYAHVVAKKVEIALEDSGLIVKTFPGEVRSKSTDFEFSSSYAETAPSHILFNSVLTTRSRTIPVDRYKEAVEFFYGVSKVEGEPVILKRR